MALTKVGPKFQVTIPKAARTAARLAVGELIEASVEGGVIILRRKVVLDRTPETDLRLAEAEADIAAGRVSPAFETAQELMLHLGGQASPTHSRTKRAAKRNP
jgi:AbrB family looped-hinge helix DNA binding protein